MLEGVPGGRPLVGSWAGFRFFRWRSSSMHIPSRFAANDVGRRSAADDAAEGAIACT